MITTIEELQINNSGLQLRDLQDTDSKDEFLGKPKDKGRNKISKTIQELKHPLLTATANIKHHPTPSRTNLKFHTKDLFISVPIM